MIHVTEKIYGIVFIHASRFNCHPSQTRVDLHEPKSIICQTHFLACARESVIADIAHMPLAACVFRCLTCSLNSTCACVCFVRRQSHTRHILAECTMCACVLLFNPVLLLLDVSATPALLALLLLSSSTPAACVFPAHNAINTLDRVVAALALSLSWRKTRSNNNITEQAWRRAKTLTAGSFLRSPTCGNAGKVLRFAGPENWVRVESWRGGGANLTTR